jgi:hypothetical protein
MIYTSYFSKSGLVPNPISIAGKCPDFFKGPEYKKLAPQYSWWKQWHDEHLSNEWYKQKYYSTILDKLNPLQVARELTSMYLGQDITLLCYERPYDPDDAEKTFCHRNLVKLWLWEAGVPCEEYYGYNNT